MTRPTILDRDDVAVVPVEPTDEMIGFGFDGWNGFAKPSNKMCNAFRRMLSSSPHSSAWQEVREYVAGLEKKEARASASLTGLLDALEHHTGERHGIMAIRHLVDRIAALELRLAEAERVIEPFANMANEMEGSSTRAGNMVPVWGFDNAKLLHGDFRAARAWKEGE